jgi:hypothetical protein
MKMSCGRTTFVSARVLALASFLLLAPSAWAQQASGIAGVVRDTSGAVLPGVTAEAASPALIEKVRTAVTDGAGRYNIVDLRPGTYVVTFSLSGFKTARREGIVLTAGFTAPVNADLEVGSLEETITVSGVSPLVDTQNVRQQNVVSTELLATLPTSSKSMANLAAIIPGYSVITDVGGSSGLYASANTGRIHGKTGAKVSFDGLNTRAAFGAGTAPGYVTNPAAAEETAVETGAISAESSQGVAINLIPKNGGNTFTGNASFAYGNDNLQSDNLSDDLRARGVTTSAKVLKFYDADFTFGGPIRRDRLWFFAVARATGAKNQQPGVYFNKTKGTPFYTPDLTRPAYFLEWLQDGGGRWTWQPSAKNKVSIFYDLQGFFNRGRGRFAAPEGQSAQFNLWPQWVLQGNWSSPVTSKLLLEGGASYAMNRWPYPSPGDTKRGFGANSTQDISITELSSGFVYNAKPYYNNQSDQPTAAQRFSVSYITGSHAFKVGFQLEEARSTSDQTASRLNQDISYGFLRGVPNRLTQYAPAIETDKTIDLGVFVQDRWTLKRLTLNYGLRYERLNGRVPAQHVEASSFVPARDFAAVDNIPNWSDLNPRVGVSYDLFGNGRTAIRASVGRYSESTGVAMPGANNPINTSVTNVTRTWTDPAFPSDIPSDGMLLPKCDLQNPNANGDCGAISDQNFGRNNPRATRYANDVLSGFNSARGAMWDVSTEVQHELVHGVSVTGGWYRNWAFNFRAVDNLQFTPEDYTSYCITAPVDARLPGGGGYQVCGLYDIAPQKFGRAENLVTRASNYAQGADITCVNQPTTVGAAAGVPVPSTCGRSDFFSVNVDTRLRRGIQLGGGVDTGRTVNDSCFVVDSPQQLQNCRQVIPFSAQTQIKIHGSYPLPAGFRVSGTLQNLSGARADAYYNAPSAEIAPSLGRNLAACGVQAVCAAFAVVPLYPPFTRFEGRFTQVDLRIAKIISLGSGTRRLRVNLDLYNALNASNILAVNSTYGPFWLQPGNTILGSTAAIMSGRLLHVGAELTF